METKTILLNIAAVVAGFIVFMGTVTVMHKITEKIVPVHEDFKPIQKKMMSDPEYAKNNPEELKEGLKLMTTANWLSVMISHVSGALTGAFVAVLIARTWHLGFALVIGILGVAAGIMNAMMIPSPGWTKIELPFYVAMALLGYFIAMKIKGK